MKLKFKISIIISTEKNGQYRKINLRKLFCENYDDQFIESTHGHSLSTSNNFISSIDDYPVRFVNICQRCKTDFQLLISGDLTTPLIQNLLYSINDKDIFNLKKKK